MLIQAGYRSKDAVYTFSFFKYATPVVFVLLSFPLAKINPFNPAEAGLKLLIPFVTAYVGFMLPNILLLNTRGKRWHKILRGLPDGLDLMMVCAEAGLTL